MRVIARSRRANTSGLETASDGRLQTGSTATGAAGSPPRGRSRSLRSQGVATTGWTSPAAAAAGFERPVGRGEVLLRGSDGIRAAGPPHRRKRGAREGARHVCDTYAACRRSPGAACRVSGGRRRARIWAKAVVAGIRWPACNGLAPGDSASARSCLPRPADQQAPELDGSVAASFREGARTPADSAMPATAAERFSADSARGGSVRRDGPRQRCLSTQVELNGVQIAPPSANLQRTGLLRWAPARIRSSPPQSR